VVGAEHGPEPLDQRHAFGNAVLEEVVAEDVHAIGAGQVMEDVAVEIGDGDPLRGLQEAAELQVLAQVRAELERHAVGAGELQVRQALARLRGERRAAGESAVEQVAEASEAGTTACHGLRRRPVGVEEARLAIGVSGDPRRHAARQLRVSGERPVLGERQLQTAPCRRQRDGRGGKRDGIGNGGLVHGGLAEVDARGYQTLLTAA